MKLVAGISLVLLAVGGWSIHALTGRGSHATVEERELIRASASVHVTAPVNPGLSSEHAMEARAQATSAVLANPEHHTSLVPTLEGDDALAAEAALGTMVREHRAAEFAQLLDTDLARIPEAASGVIQAVAAYAARGTASEQTQAVRTLGRWLSEDTGRPGVYAAANMPTLVEALAEVGGTGAREALVSLLESGKAELSVETLAVQKLAPVGVASERAAVTHFLDRVRSLPEAQGIERELQAEAIEAGVEALKEAKRR